MVSTVRRAAVALVMLAVGASASAGTVTPVSFTTFVVDSGVFNESFTIDPAYDGRSFKATITDFNAPSSFQTLTLAVTSVSPVGLIDFVDGAGGSDHFYFKGFSGVNYVANVAAVTGQLNGVGLLGAEVALVPIPAAGVMFLSALVGLGVVARRRRADARGG